MYETEWKLWMLGLVRHLVIYRLTQYISVLAYFFYITGSLLFFGKQQLLFFAKSPLSSIFATFPILYVWEAAAAYFYTFFSLYLLSSCCFFFCQISPLLFSPLFCRWWNCLSLYIICNMSWWSRTCEELVIISSRPYIAFSSLLCYDALMLQVQDQMMIDMFLRPLPLLLLFFWYIVVL